MSTANLEQETDKSLLIAELERLYTCCLSSLTKAADRILHNPSDAEDCVHDVLLRLYQRPWLYRKGRSGLHTFLTVCVQREALARRRLVARRLRIVERFAGPNQTQELEVPDFVEVDRLRHAIRALPVKQRTALVYAFYKQLSHREIATSLALPVGTIKSRLSNAIRKLNADLRN